jgi:hypothetical protein
MAIPDCPIPPALPGEAAPDRYGGRTGDGLPADLGYAVFPIVRYVEHGKIDLLGTGFFIATCGVFVTARHVLKAPFDDRTGRQLYSIASPYLFPLPPRVLSVLSSSRKVRSNFWIAA